MSTKFTYDSFVKLADEVKLYDDWAPEILSKDQEKLKLVNAKVLPFAFQNMLQRTVVNKDAGGKNRERFLDLLTLDYGLLGKKSLQEAQEMYLKQLSDIKASFPDVVKGITSTDTTTALRIEQASKNIELMTAALKTLNQAAIQKDLDARLALTAPADATAVSRPVLIAYSLSQAYDDAVAAKAIDAAAATTEKALVIPPGTVGSEIGPAFAAVTIAKPGDTGTTVVTVGATPAATTTPAAAATPAAATPAATTVPAAATPAATTAAKPATPPAAETTGPTAAYSPPGADNTSKTTTSPPPSMPTVAPVVESSGFLGLPIWAIVSIAVGIVLFLAALAFIIFGNKGDKEEEEKESIGLVDVQQPPLIVQ